MMKASLEVELKPFNVPNFVILKPEVGKREDGMKEPISLPLSQLSAGTLEKMCEEFTREVFRKSGKNRPVARG